MRWPFRFKLRGAQTPPAPSGLPSAASSSMPTPRPATRPATGLEFISDLTSDFKKAGIFVFIVGSVAVIVAGCVAGDCFAVMEAAKEVRGVPASVTASIGAGGASVLTLISALIMRGLRSLSRGGRQTESSGSPNERNP